ncbi:MAG TPA: hypothetical protein VF275_01715 [Gammaproteobacteria bacterium]
MSVLTAGNSWRASGSFYLLLFVVVPATFIVHEFAHWVMGELLGYSMTMSLNAVSPAEGGYRSAIDAMLVSAAGPLITILQAVIAYLLIRRSGSALFYPFLFIALFMRAAAMLVSIANPNDEARISMMLGIGTWTLPALVISGLFAMTWMASRKLGLHWTVNVYSYIVASVGVTGVVYLNAVLTGIAFIPG